MRKQLYLADPPASLIQSVSFIIIITQCASRRPTECCSGAIASRTQSRADAAGVVEDAVKRHYEACSCLHLTLGINLLLPPYQLAAVEQKQTRTQNPTPTLNQTLTLASIISCSGAGLLHYYSMCIWSRVESLILKRFSRLYLDQFACA